MSTLRELVAKWREIEKELITHVPGMERHIELREGRRIGLLLDELAAALVAEGQGAPDFAALPYKLTVDLSNYLENHRDCLPKTIALRRDIEFIVKVAMKEVAERAAAPSLHKEGAGGAPTIAKKLQRVVNKWLAEAERLHNLTPDERERDSRRNGLLEAVADVVAFTAEHDCGAASPAGRAEQGQQKRSHWDE